MDSTLQSRLHLWRQRNFPTADADQQLFGVVEEVGELAHANLKRKQGIRGTLEQHIAAERDAVGDILIYLAGYCSYKGWDMLAIYQDTADHVTERDWIADPKSGKATADDAPVVSTHIRNSDDQDPDYKRLPN